MEKHSSDSEASPVDQNASSFMVVQGYLVRLGVMSMINSPRAGLYPVKWLNDRVPDKAKLGSYITITGQLVTLDLGRVFLIIKAQALKPKSIRKIKKLIKEELQ